MLIKLSLTCFLFVSTRILCKFSLPWFSIAIFFLSIKLSFSATDTSPLKTGSTYFFCLLYTMSVASNIDSTLIPASSLNLSVSIFICSGVSLLSVFLISTPLYSFGIVLPSKALPLNPNFALRVPISKIIGSMFCIATVDSFIKLSPFFDITLSPLSFLSIILYSGFNIPPGVSIVFFTNPFAGISPLATSLA